jgi:16S rRNA (guanine(966)-N(2))-methyltransferase RsmD
VLDLFAGSGQMGLEALSRGAASVTFADPLPEARAVVKENATRCGFYDKCRYLISDYRNVIRKAAGRDLYDLVFIDPPYAMNAAGDAVLRLLEAGILAKGAIIVTEAGSEPLFETLPVGLTVRKTARYSVSYLTILEWEGIE